MKKRGKLVVIEGIDGTGKTTQARLLLKCLRREEHPAALLRFPQYQTNVFGGLIRELLDGKHGDPTKANPYLAATLYAADRFETKRKLLTLLAQGDTVICDRYVSANMIHQGGKIRSRRERARFFRWLENVEHRVFGLPKPTMTIYLSLRPHLAGALLKRKDGVERSHAYNRDSFNTGKQLARQKGWVVISCEQRGRVLPREAIHERIFAAVKNRL